MKKLWVVSLLAGMATSPAVLAAAAAATPNANPDTATTATTTPPGKGAAVAAPRSVAPTKTATNSTQAEINDLKKRIARLEQQEDVNETRNYMIGTDMQFGVGSGTYSDEIYIIDFGLNRDLSLLHERQYIHSKYKRFENEPHLLISGNISGTAGKHSSRFGTELSEHDEFMKAEAEMDFTAMINEDWLGYLEINGNAFGEDTGISVKQAFTTWGNFDKSPMYMTLGYQYVPFGSFTTNFIESTSVQDLGRIQVPAATGAFNVVTKDALEVNGAVFWFDGMTKNTEEFRLNEIGANLQARQRLLGPNKNISIMGGVSVVNNLASSNGMSDIIVADLDSTLEHYVPAVDVRTKLIVGPFSLTAEYLTATRAFDNEDFVQVHSDGAHSSQMPTATYVEAAIDYKVWGMPNTFSGRWGQTSEALAFGLPMEEYGLSYQLAPYFNTRITFEYMHKIDYSESTTVFSANADGGLGHTYAGTGRDDDVFQAQINVFF